MRLSKVDPNSYSTPETVKITHVNLDWNVDFSRHVIHGSAELIFDILAPGGIEQILLDCSDLKISDVSVKSSSTTFPISFAISDQVKEIGSKLTLELPTKTTGKLNVLVQYETAGNASALQWLTPEQTLGKKSPYMFSQCQAIHARSILPCQDTPAVKFTFNAKITHPVELTALMGAIITKKEGNCTHFEQVVPVPSYLIAIAVGDVKSKRLSDRCQVWSEEEILNACAEEFSETPRMLEKAEEICGPYVWKQYDLLILPKSFPFGGMENPCLTFVTPSVLAGDKSLADVVAHEIAHSWTGNLVTNENFEHFWLNEGFTVFVEGKIVGRLSGDKQRDFHSILGLSELKDGIAQLSATPELTKLVVDLTNYGPDDAFSVVPYVKGATFLRYLEQEFGGPAVFEPFFRDYITKFKYRSIETNAFKKALYDYFRDGEFDSKLGEIDWDTWLYSTGMPPIIPKYDRSLVDAAAAHAKLFAENSVADIRASPLLTEKLATQQIIETLSQLLVCPSIVDLNSEKIGLLETTYGISRTKNAEIRFRFSRLCIKARLETRLPEIIEFANSAFRLKFVRPVYRELGEWAFARPIAIANFEQVKNQMMQVSATMVAKDLNL